MARSGAADPLAVSGGSTTWAVISIHLLPQFVDSPSKFLPQTWRESMFLAVEEISKHGAGLKCLPHVKPPCVVGVLVNSTGRLDDCFEVVKYHFRGGV
jgi:hypothetical protein